MTTRIIASPLTLRQRGVQSNWRDAAVHIIRLWLRRSRARAELGMLTERQRQDMGLDPDLIRRETAKPFWRA